jgi:MoxR-like ATPase
MPEGVQNVLLPALDEGLLIVPRIGEVHAAAGFQVVATQNPVEYIATGHLSEALRDRFEHVGLHYQDEAEEVEIVRRETGCHDPALVADAVALTRATRSDPRFRKGASVRAAIAMVALVAASDAPDAPDALRRAASAALPTRVELRDEAAAPLPDVLDELVEGARKKA